MKLFPWMGWEASIEINGGTHSCNAFHNSCWFTFIEELMFAHLCGRGRQRFSTCCFTPLIPTEVRAGAGLTQEPETKSRSSVWESGFLHCHWPHPRVLMRRKLESGAWPWNWSFSYGSCFNCCFKSFECNDYAYALFYFIDVVFIHLVFKIFFYQDFLRNFYFMYFILVSSI